MPYELIRHTFGKDSGCKQEIFGIEKNYPGIFKEWLKNYPAIIELAAEEIFEDIVSTFNVFLTTFFLTIKLKLTKSGCRFFHLLNR